MTSLSDLENLAERVEQAQNTCRETLADQLWRDQSSIKGSGGRLNHKLSVGARARMEGTDRG